MSSRTSALSWQRILAYFLIGALSCLNAAWADVTGGIATDGTMGAAQTLSGVNVTVPQNLGTTVGNNLFHSFTEFNIANGQTVDFTGSNALQNVISRVTGADVSEIEGTLKSSIANAAFYLINPNGITFGTNAQVDVPGAFHVSTANKIDFLNNGGAFYADSNQTSTLSSEAPAAFGFLETSAANNGLIDINSSQLTAKEGQTLDVVASEITIENSAAITALAGEIRLVALQGAGSVSLEKTTDGALPLPVATPSAINAGNITVDASDVRTTGDGGGRIALWGGDTSFTNNAKAHADNNGATDPTSAKDVNIRAYSLNMNSSSISSRAYGAGNAGHMTLEIISFLDILKGGYVSSTTFAKGAAGNISITANTLTIDGQGDLTGTGIFSAANESSSGNAGSLIVTAKNLDIFNVGLISCGTWSTGKAGTVQVTADTLWIDGQNANFLTGIFSSAYKGSGGDAGSVAVKTKNLEILNAGGISSDTSSTGNAGTVQVVADTLLIDDQNADATHPTYISSEAKQNSSGNAGNVTVTAKNIEILSEAFISSDTSGSGNAGNVNVTAESLLSLSSSNISSDAAKGTGSAGNVTVNAKILNIIDSEITSQSFTSGNAGDVFVTADIITIKAVDLIAGISTDSYGFDSNSSAGIAGNVTVSARTLSLNGDSSISSFSGSKGRAGNVTIDTGTLSINNDGFISSGALSGSSGKTGHVNITATDWLHMTNGGQIGIENGAIMPASEATSITPGNITITSPNIDMKDSQISSNSTGNVAAGNIIINGGELISLQNSGFKTSVSKGNGSGGDIFVKANTLVMDTGLIQANAIGGSGGNINLNLNTLIPSGNTLIKGGSTIDWQPGLNVIQAASKAGVSGTVSVTAPQLNLSGIIANLGGSQFDTGLISQDYCGVGAGSSLTRKGNGGLPPKSGDQLLF